MRMETETSMWCRGRLGVTLTALQRKAGSNAAAAEGSWCSCADACAIGSKVKINERVVVVLQTFRVFTCPKIRRHMKEGVGWKQKKRILENIHKRGFESIESIRLEVWT